MLIAALGNEYRGDDGVAMAIVREVARKAGGAVQAAVIADPLDLIGRWDDAHAAVLVDAARSADPVGTVHVLDEAAILATPSDWSVSSHSLGVSSAVRLARTLRSGPKSVYLLAVTGGSFGYGDQLSPAVTEAVPGAVRDVLEILELLDEAV